jgi:hypothetical protein
MGQYKQNVRIVLISLNCNPGQFLRTCKLASYVILDLGLQVTMSKFS